MNDPLLEIRNLQIDGESDEIWHEIIKGIDLHLDQTIPCRSLRVGP